MTRTEKRIEALVRLGNYMLSEDEQWQETKWRATNANAWFTLENIDLAVNNIVKYFLQRDLLTSWIEPYAIAAGQKKLGIVMAGNIPLVGFHDFLCGFVSGHELFLKLSSKDEVLLKHLIGKLCEWYPEFSNDTHIADNLRNCDAYIATGSNNTARYFEQYFGKYPHIIRKNRTSVAILEGDETPEELNALAEDVFMYYGLGCRNVTQLCVPKGYNFDKLLELSYSYKELTNHHKYKNNYDYYLAIYLLNRVPCFTNEVLLLVENDSPFSAVSVLHYRFYEDLKTLAKELEANDAIQAVVGRGFTPFGTSQQPSLNDYADGVDTMKFLAQL
ncbi:MAG TPA: acyl-CoA reductase [Flavipsychrobacter sp.]|nr:acyl-CoA reductase [Flavipsychrobacter sp.]